MDIFANYQQAREKMYNITNHQGNQIKTAMRNHLSAVRMAIIRKTSNSKCWWDVERREPLCTVGRLDSLWSTQE